MFAITTTHILSASSVEVVAAEFGGYRASGTCSCGKVVTRATDVREEAADVLRVQHANHARFAGAAAARLAAA